MLSLVLPVTLRLSASKSNNTGFIGCMAWAVFVSDAAFVLLKWSYNQTRLNANSTMIIRHMKPNF